MTVEELKTGDSATTTKLQVKTRTSSTSSALSTPSTLAGPVTIVDETDSPFTDSVAVIATTSIAPTTTYVRKQRLHLQRRPLRHGQRPMISHLQRRSLRHGQRPISQARVLLPQNHQ